MCFMRTDLSTFANTVYRRFTCIREDDMAGGNSSWADRWRGFLGFSPGTTRRALEILSQRYIEESQHIERYNEHARKMQYPQFRDRLLAIAADEAEHVKWIAEQIKLVGGRVPR